MEEEAPIEPIPVPAVEDVGGGGGDVHLQQLFHQEGPSDVDPVVPHLPPHVPPQEQDYHDNGGEAAAAADMAAPLKRDAEQDVATLNQNEEAKRQKTVSGAKNDPNKKDRHEFTASEKLRILDFLYGNRDELATTTADGNNISPPPPQQPALSNKQIRAKFGVSKSSLHRWKQQKERIQIMVQSEGLGKRKRDTKDPLEKVKIRLQKFYNENMEKCSEERLIITTPVVQAMASKIRDELLAEYDAAVADAAAAAAIDSANDGEQQKMQQEPPELHLNKEELKSLREFKVTKSWAGRVASNMGWLSQPRGKKSSNPQQEATPVDGVLRVEAPTAADVAATDDTTTVNTEQITAAKEKAKLNTLAFLSKSHPEYSVTNPKAKKTRKEFTAVEKLAIVAEMDPQQTSNPLVMADICEKYSTTKSSVFRWKQQFRAGTLTQMINEEGRGSFKRDVNDKLGKVKLQLRDFIENNRAQPPETRGSLSGGVLQDKAQKFRDELLAQHDFDPSKSNLTDDEVEALKKFKASKGWARRAAARYGWKEVPTVGDPSYGAAFAAAASVAAAEGTVDALMGHPTTPVDLPQLAQHESEVMRLDDMQHEHDDDAVNEAMMDSVMETVVDLAGTAAVDEGQYQV